MTALVRKSETSTLLRKVGLLDVISPRTIAAERIRNYIESDYQSRIVSFENGAAEFIQRRIDPQSASAGGRLGDIEIPRCLIVAILRTDARLFHAATTGFRPAMR